MVEPGAANNALDVVTVAAERHLQRRNRPAQQRRQVLGQRLSAGKLLALIHDRNTRASHHGCGLSRDVTTKSVRSLPRSCTKALATATALLRHVRAGNFASPAVSHRHRRNFLGICKAG